MQSLACPPACGPVCGAPARRCSSTQVHSGSRALRLPGRRPRSRPAGAAANEAGEAFLPVFHDPATSTSWHFVIANADFMLNDENNEHFPEVLRERRRFFLENQAPVNFFLVANPAWLDSLPEVAKQVRQPAVALVSPDAQWITCVTPPRTGAPRLGPWRVARHRDTRVEESDTSLARVSRLPAAPHWLFREAACELLHIRHSHRPTACLLSPDTSSSAWTASSRASSRAAWRT